MTNDELKLEIISLIRDSKDEWMGKDCEGHSMIYLGKIADALIAAGLHFGENLTATFDRMALEREHELERRLAEAEHRAETLERAFRNFLAEYFTAVNEQNSYDCGIPEMFGRYVNVLPNEDKVTNEMNKYLSEAEEELNKESKD